jgi:transcriptional regulator with XRE-family HTH domain
MPASGPDPIDQLIGQNVRAQRVKAGLSQAQLGKAIRVTFQQVQKYETAANRISAGRLYEVAKALGFPVAAFFDGLGKADEVPGARFAAPPSLRKEREAHRLIQAYSQIADVNLRLRIVQLVEQFVAR